MTKEVKNAIIKALEIANEHGISEGYDYLDNAFPNMWEFSEEWQAIAYAYYKAASVLGLD